MLMFTVNTLNIIFITRDRLAINMYYCYLPALTGSLISGCSPSNVVKLCKLNRY